MSNYSERKLQQALHQAGFYTQKAPSSGHGILDEETEEYIDQADIVAIKRITITEEDANGNVVDRSLPVVLIIEEKHRKPPTCQILDEEKHQLERIEEITGAEAYVAVSWKNYQGGHQFFRIQDLVDTGQHWKITQEMNGMVLEDGTLQRQ
jgi:Holliday junction resolvase